MGMRFFTGRKPRALRFTAENTLFSPSRKALVVRDCLREPAYCSVGEIPAPRPLSQGPTLILPRGCGITVPIFLF